MDTSKEYILMASKAKEIQQLNNAPIKFFAGYNLIADTVITCGGDFWFCKYVNDNLKRQDIWLPRQDQLQEMVKADEGCKGKDEVYWKINWFWEYVQDTCFTGGEDYGNYTNQAFDTMEQLWLAFVMHEKYGKVWNGEEWELLRKE